MPIERQASAGTFIKIPPQRQIDIAQRKQIIVDEHSGRILVDKELAEEEKSRMDTIMDKELKKLKHWYSGTEDLRKVINQIKKGSLHASPFSVYYFMKTKQYYNL